MDTSKDKEDNNTTLSFPNLQTDIEMHTTFYKDFFGEDKQQPLCDDDDNMKETNPMFRSNSGSFRYMRFKVAGSSRRGSWRSSSLSVMASKSKSRWQVFMFGFGSGKFPTKMDLVDIKTRQLRTKEVQNVDNINNNGVCRDINDGRMMSGKKVWWRLVDVLGCGGGYDHRNNMVLV